MQSKPDIKYVPIFDQSLDVIWYDFERLQRLCDIVEFGHSNSNYDIYAAHQHEWENENYNFAFAAYDGSKMVGFVNGYLENRTNMYLHNLYVDPHYQNMRIGSELLNQTERAASLVAKTIKLKALHEKSIRFYAKHGYQNQDGRNRSKKFPNHVVGVVPVFKPLPKIVKNIKIDCGGYNFSKNCEHKPLFVYVNDKNEIDGVAVQNREPWLNQSKRGMVDFYRNQLLRALDKVK